MYARPQLTGLVPQCSTGAPTMMSPRPSPVQSSIPETDSPKKALADRATDWSVYRCAPFAPEYTWARPELTGVPLGCSRGAPITMSPRPSPFKSGTPDTEEPNCALVWGIGGRSVR